MLAQYIAGECTPAQVTAVKAWVDRSPENRTELATLQALWSGSEGPEHLPVVESSPAWKQFQVRVRQTSDASSQDRRLPASAVPLYPPLRGHSGRWRPIAGFAGLMAIAVSLVLLISHAKRAQSGVSGFREFATSLGRMDSVTLVDGTRAILGPGTRLRVPRDFGVGTRQVMLDGEAVFHVVHNAAHPFAVRTSRATFEDIGTTFDVRSYATDGTDAVAVAEGAVALDHLVLHTHDIAQVDAMGRITVRTGADIDPYLSWPQGRLVFDAAPLRDVVRELSRRFNLTITIADSTLAGQLVTGTFTDQSADVILEDVTAIVGGQYRRTDQTVVIHRRVSGAHHRETAHRPLLNTALTTDAHS